MYALYHVNDNSIIVADKSEKLIKQLRLILKSKILTDMVEIPQDFYTRDGNRYGFTNIVKHTELARYEIDPGYLVDIKNYADYCAWVLHRVDNIVQHLTDQIEPAYTELTSGLCPENDGVFDEYFSEVNAAVQEFNKQIHEILYWEKTPQEADACIMDLNNKLFENKFVRRLQNNFFRTIHERKYQLV
jgi:hypothetical protein